MTVTVDCGCEWTVDNGAADLFSTTLSTTTLTVAAGQNTVEEEISGTITLMTSAERISFATIAVTQAAYGAPEITVETNEVNFAATGELTAELAVEATADWTAEPADAWLTVEKSGDGITLTASENEDTAERSTKVTLTCTDGYGTTYEYVNVSQDGKAYVTLSQENVSFTGAGDSAAVTVESNYDWDFTYDTDNGWYTVTRDGDSLIISSTKDNETAEDFESTITVTAGDGAENVVEAQITVVEENIGNALILVYTITNVGTTVTLPLQGTVNCTVDWGDGNEDTVTSTKPTHTYVKTGEFIVVVKGTVTSLSHSGINSTSAVNTSLTAVRQWGNTGLTSASYAMYYCEGLTSIPDDTFGSFADVTGCDYMFEYCTSLTSIPEKLFAYAEKAANFNYCFAYCSGLTEIPAGLFDKCFSAGTFEFTFRSCSGIKEIPSGLFDACTAATSFYYTFSHMDALATIPTGIFSKNTEATTFYGCFCRATSLTTIPENLFANCSKVTSFSYTFYEDPALTTLPESTFAGCTGVTTFMYAFASCPALTSVPENLFKDCTAATTFTHVFRETGLTSVPENIFANNTAATSFAYSFYGCDALTSVPEGLFSKNAAVTTFAYCFYNCSALSEIGPGLFAGKSAVATFAYAFYGCSALKEIGSGQFAGDSEVTTFASAFSGCSALTAIPENIFSDCKAVTNFSSTFKGCTALTGESAYDVITVNGESVNVHLYERSSYADIYTVPTSIGSCYDSCSGLSDYVSIPRSWGGGEVVDFAAVVGTYTAEGYTYYSAGVAAETTWTLKIYESSKSGYYLFIDGLVPYTAGKYPDSEAFIAQALYSDGKITIPAQATGSYFTSNGYYIGWYPCSKFENDSWYRSEDVTNVTFTYDSVTDTWTSDYGVFCALFLYNIPSFSYFVGFMDVANPGITLKRTSTSTGVSPQSLKSADGIAREISDNVVIHTDSFLAD